MTSMASIITAHNVSFAYAGSADLALTDLSFDILEGQFVMLTGPTGSGKTTLLRLLQGLIPHFHRGTLEGKILVDGIDTQQSSIASNATRVGYVFQDPELQVIGTTVERDVAFGLENLAIEPVIIKDAVQNILQVLSLVQLSDRHPSQLSGGQLRLVSLASILVMQPKILILDEAVTYLDAKNVESLVEILRTLKQQGFTIIYSGHDLQHTLPLADVLWVIENGRLTHQGSPEDVFTNKKAAKTILVPPLVQSFLRLRKKRPEFQIPLPRNTSEALEWLTENDLGLKTS
jgi:energy-coupling factor transporter ATP-binding protein EcfA2